MLAGLLKWHQELMVTACGANQIHIRALLLLQRVCSLDKFLSFSKPQGPQIRNANVDYLL